MGNLFVLEVGTEEIPAAPLSAATIQLKELACAALDEARIAHGDVETLSTPRRLILTIKNLADESTPLMSRHKGPAVEIAFDGDGNPTKAAIGFAKGKGLEVKDLQRGKEGDREYVYAIVEQRARKTRSILPGIMSDLIAAISWPKSQRWGTGDARFSRPVRWILALLGDEIVPVTFAGLEAGRLTHGHRLLANEPYEVETASKFFDILALAWVVPSPAIRAAKIRKQIAAFEEQTGLVARTPDKTFEEVVNLVEHPTVLMGHFDEDFLRVPSEIITDAMLSHQRYFPMYEKDGKLNNAFLLVSNGAMSRSDVIVDGNERVVRARLADAAFFYDEDRKRPLESYVSDLDKVVFQEKLGTVGAKTSRIEKLVALLGSGCGCTEQEQQDMLRAAKLCKADLVTNAVVEFTSLQGIMGGYYARESGENEAVATAVSQHYRPRFAGDALPDGLPGKMVALCDKLDTVCGIFAIDQAPTGSSDPFAVRRAAIGIISLLLSGVKVSLADAIHTALDIYEEALSFSRETVEAAVVRFFTGRLEVIARDKGFATDTVDAVLATGIIEPVVVLDRCQALTSARKDDPETFLDLATAYTRAANLTDASLGTVVNEELMGSEDATLFVAVDVAGKQVNRALEAGDYAAAIHALAALRAPIDRFFLDVLIMDKDEKVRTNRLCLLNRFVDVFARVADIGKLGVH